MRIKHILSLSALSAIAMFSLGITGCKNDPVTPPPVVPPVVTDTSSLIVTATPSDTVFTAEGEAFSISFLVMKGSKPVDSAFIDFYDSILSKPVRIGPLGPSGSYVFHDTLPQQNVQHRVYQFTIVASKGTQSDTICRYVKVDVDPNPLVLAVTAPVTDTCYVRHGASLTFNFHITHLGLIEDSIFVHFFDPLPTLQGVPRNLGPTTGGTGNLTVTDTIGADVPAGAYPIEFIASRRNRLPSNTVTKIVWVIGSDSVQMGLSAHSISPTSIGVAWSSVANDKGIDTVFAMNGNTIVAAVPVPAKKNASATLTGLAPGVTYAISVHATVAYSETILWATATRFGPIRIYRNDQGDAAHPCGLVLGTQGVEYITATSAAPQSDLMLSYDLSAVSTTSLNSVSVTSLSHRSDGKITQFGSGYIVTAAGLDNINYRQDLSHKFDSSFNVYQVPDGASQSNVIFPVLTGDNHYALVELMSQPDGSLIGMSNGMTFVDLIVSYQPTAGLPYAGRARMRRGTETPRVGKLP